MASMLTRAMSWPALTFTFATWIIFLAGIACLQHNCSDGTTGRGTAQAPFNAFPDNLNTFGTSGIFGWSGNVLPCARLFRFFWFMIAFLFITLVGAFIASGPKYGLQNSRSFWVGMFAVNTLLFMIASEATLAALDSSPFSRGRPLNCMRTAAAGAIMTVFGTIFLLLSIGTDWEGRRGRGADDHKGTTYTPRERTEALPTIAPASAGPVTYTGTNP